MNKKLKKLRSCRRELFYIRLDYIDREKGIMVAREGLPTHTADSKSFRGNSVARRTYEKDGQKIEFAMDVDDLVSDKRAGWRADPARARRRQRRYKKRLTDELLHSDVRSTGRDGNQ